jgi:hypothetical protein
MINIGPPVPEFAAQLDVESRQHNWPLHIRPKIIMLKRKVPYSIIIMIGFNGPPVPEFAAQLDVESIGLFIFVPIIIMFKRKVPYSIMMQL